MIAECEKALRVGRRAAGAVARRDHRGVDRAGRGRHVRATCPRWRASSQNRLEAGHEAAARLDRELRDRKFGITTTPRTAPSTSRYNTYKYPGLPIGPITSPGLEAIKAAMDPAPGNWRYFVTVNPDTGETLFAVTEAEHPGTSRSSRLGCGRTRRVRVTGGDHRAAVLGSPVAHSLSPVLHRAAYAALGLAGWEYDARECDEAALPGAAGRAGRDVARAVADDAAQARRDAAAGRGEPARRRSAA